MAAVAVLVMAGSAAAGFQNEPAGFGEVRLRASVETAKRALPGLEAAGGVPEAKVAFYRLAGQKYLGLDPCALRFNFVDDQLYEIQFDCGRDEKVRETLEREFGRPAVRESYGVFWYGDRAVLSLSPGSNAFGLSDRALLQAANQAILRAMATAKTAETPPAGK